MTEAVFFHKMNKELIIVKLILLLGRSARNKL